MILDYQTTFPIPAIGFLNWWFALKKSLTNKTIKMAYNGYLRDNADTFESFATSYVDFTSSLITSTFEALMDSTLQQLEAYTDMVGILSFNLSEYINNTANEISDDQVLDYLEELPLNAAGVLAEGTSLGLEYVTPTGAGTEARRLVELDAQGNQTTTSATSLIQSIGSAITGVLGSTGGTGGIVANAVGAIGNAISLPSSSNIDSLAPITAEMNGGNGVNNLNTLIFKAVSQRIASNKYALLQNMVEMGLIRLVIDRGIIETRLDMSFREVDKFSRKESNKIKDRTKSKTKVKSKNSFQFFLFRNKNKEKAKTKHVHLEVNKTKEKQSLTNEGSVNTRALVRIEFSSDYKKL